MKKLFLVEAENWDYDEYDSIIVIANSEQEAIEICDGYFLETQGEITAKEINLNTDESKVILASFNAG